MKKLRKESSTYTDCSFRVDYQNFNEDSAFIEKQLNKIAEKKLLITKMRDYKFYLRIILVSILSSLYYCLILSMDKEIKLVTAKIFHSIIVFFLTIIENFLMGQVIRAGGHMTSPKSYADQKYSLDTNYKLLEKESEIEGIGNTQYEEIDNKEMYFYNVI